ncbi:HU family DNA-binding protein [Acidithiobacillus ferriphilus]|uniref:HU family DNA-binding protein n=1 Tax=Acidithiobacillus ferriphilus TaxID=1689834 RepID=UPI002DBED560|nr:HU family DNA-binding protein [Acidithiobacillus ferriphilus]MEB8476710.1 HU family DNA-binding protein [Acidithiobacillus ferriphilus]
MDILTRTATESQAETRRPPSKRLIRRYAMESGVTHSEAARIIRGVTLAIRSEIQSGQTVRLTGIGTFQIAEIDGAPRIMFWPTRKSGE